MSTSGIGSTPSFWQQDQSYWSQQQSSSNSVAATDSVINAISTAETNKGKGLASIANKTALNRVNSQLTAAIQSILDSAQGSSSSTASSSSSSSSSGSTASIAKPATGTGTSPLTLSTPLWELGFQAGGSVTISAGGNTTTYTSTGSDTVGDLIVALNSHQYGNAPVTASLNSRGDLVLTANNTTDTVTVGGTYASNIGFAPANRTFKPTAGTASSTTSSSSAASTKPSASTLSSSASTSAAAKKSYTTTASEMLNTAASVLSDSGAGGSLVDMLS